MAYQSQFNGYMAYKVQSGLGVQATGSGGTVLRSSGGQGARLTKAVQESQEVRRDGQRQRGRHGTQQVAGSFDTELSIGGQERLIEAIIRGTFGSDLVITQATAGLTSVVTAANTLTAGGGSWITAGVKVGDVFQLTNVLTANGSKNIRAVGVTASVITTAETLTPDSPADTTFTLTVPKKLTCPAAGSLLERYFTIEEVFTDIDASSLVTDFKWGSMRMAMAANGIVNCTFGGAGTGKYDMFSTSGSPVLTSPTETTADSLAVVDATIRINGVDMVSLSSFEITMDNGATTIPVFGSGAQKYSPDVFTGQLGLTMSFTALRTDLQRLIDFSAETQMDFSVLMVENEAEPKSFISCYVPNFTIGDVARSALSRQAGPMTETITVPMALIGKDNRGGAYDGTMCNWQSSGA